MTPEWHEVARRMRLDGKHPTEIALTLGVSRGAVRHALEPRRDKKPRKRSGAGHYGPRKGGGQLGNNHRAGKPAERVPTDVRLPRAVRRIIADPETIRAAARAFARGDMPVSDLMAMITVGASDGR